jgi:hypothetical protein
MLFEKKTLSELITVLLIKWENNFINERAEM